MVDRALTCLGTLLFGFCVFGATGCESAWVMEPADLSPFLERAEAKAPPAIPPPYELAVARVQINRIGDDPVWGTPPGLLFSRATIARQDDQQVVEGVAISGFVVAEQPGTPGFVRAIALNELDGVGNVVVVTSDLVSERMANAESLLVEARKRNASLLLIYTLQGVSGRTAPLGPLTQVLELVTLGLFPTRIGKAEFTAGAALVDVGSGFIHAKYIDRQSTWQLANLHTLHKAELQAFRRAEERAAVGVLNAFADDWPSLMKRLSATNEP